MIKKHGFIALLDILGFSERISADPEAGGIDRYIDTVVQQTTTSNELRVILFSDTVVLFTIDDTAATFNAVIAATSRLIHALLHEEVPLRGAISHGRFARSDNDVHGTVLAGRPIIEAHAFESQLQWIGVMLAPSVLRQLPDLCKLGFVSGPRPNETRESYFDRACQQARVQPCKRIPIERAHGAALSYMEGLAIVPISGQVASPAELPTCLSKNISKLRSLKLLAPDPRSQAKYQNTIDWLEAVQIEWTTRLK